MKKKSCSPEEIAFKSTFLGPQAENADWVQKEIQNILIRWFRWRKEFAPEDGCAISVEDQNLNEFKHRQDIFDKSLNELMTRFEKELPKFSPRYIGHMFSEISLPALFGHFITLLHNPNNISHEASQIGVEIEFEAIAKLLHMIGYGQQGSGHFTSGGTIANFEALVRARQRSALWLSTVAVTNQKSVFELAHQGWSNFNEINSASDVSENLKEYDYSVHNPYLIYDRFKKKVNVDFQGPVILVPENKHYSWIKSVSLMGLGDESYWPVQLDSLGRLSIESLKKNIEKAAVENRPILSVVSVLGTTEMANLDPVHEVNQILNTYKQENNWHIWHHIDAAYGGFFCTMLGLNLNQYLQQVLQAVRDSDSVTLDPHKLGYVPYACGAFLIKDQRNDKLKDIGAKYIDFKNSHDRGPYTIEGSRPATGAAATWMIDRCVGLDKDGYGRILYRTIIMKNEFEQYLATNCSKVQLAHTDTNIICFHVHEKTLSEGNKKTKRLYELFKEHGEFYVSKTTLNTNSYRDYVNSYLKKWSPIVDSDEVVLLRLCIMNPFINSKEMDLSFNEQFIQELEANLAQLT